MIDPKWRAENQGRLFWVYVAKYDDGLSVTNYRMFFDYDQAVQFVNDMNIHPQYGKHRTWSVDKIKTII